MAQVTQASSPQLNTKQVIRTQVAEDSQPWPAADSADLSRRPCAFRPTDDHIVSTLADQLIEPGTAEYASYVDRVRRSDGAARSAALIPPHCESFRGDIQRN